MATFGAGTIGSAQISDNAITNAKMADNAIATAELADNAVTDAEIGAHTTTKITVPGTLLSLASEARNDLMRFDGTDWVADDTAFDDDFYQFDTGIWTSTTAGTGTQARLTSVFGIEQLDTGATNASSSGILSGPVNLISDNPTMVTRLRVPTINANTKVVFGFSTDVETNPGGGTARAAFEVNGTQWRCRTHTGAAETVTNFTGPAANTFAVFEIVVTSGTNVVYKVNGTTEVTITTNLPGAAGAAKMNFGVQMDAGASSQKLEIDWVRVNR